MVFSVIVPVYNCEEFIRDCLNSIVRQTFKDYEVIIIDDGSTDNSSIICDEYSAMDNRFHVYHKQNGGVVSARKFGVLSAKGEYVISVDGDDYISEMLLETVYSNVKQYDYDIVLFNAYSFFKESQRPLKNLINAGNYIGSDTEKIKRDFMFSIDKKNMNYGGVLFSLWSKAIKRDLLLNAQMPLPNSISKGDDLAVLSRVVYTSWSFCILSQTLYFYRENDKSIMHSFSENEIDRMMDLWNYLSKIVPQEYYNNFRGFCLTNLFEYVNSLAKTENNYFSFHRKLKLIRKKIYDYIYPINYKNYNLKTKLKLFGLNSFSIVLFGTYHFFRNPK